VKLEKPKATHYSRVVHIHKNVSGMLAAINKVFAKKKINILGQSLGTNQEVGFAVIDIEGKIPNTILGDLKKIPNTVFTFHAK